MPNAVVSSLFSELLGGDKVFLFPFNQHHTFLFVADEVTSLDFLWGLLIIALAAWANMSDMRDML